MRIAYYISNHGFGHATRSAALIYELSKVGIFSIICTNRPKALFDKIAKKNILYHEANLDFGVFQKDLIQPDIQKTENEILNHWQQKEVIIQSEIDFLSDKKIDLIIADIPPFALDIANKMQIPSIAISNFDWYYVYSKLLDRKKLKSIMKDIYISYMKADYAIRLPFSNNESMLAYKEVYKTGILAWKSKSDKDWLCDRFGFDKTKNTILIGFGGEGENPFSEEDLEYFHDYQIVSKYDIKGAKRITLVDDYQKILASVDVVLTKAGYSTLAEAVQSGKYLIVSARKNYPEDFALVAELKNYPNHYYIGSDGFDNLDWEMILSEAQNSKPKILPQYKNANREIAELIISKFYESISEKIAIIIIGTNNLQLLWAESQFQKIFLQSTDMTGIGREMKNGFLAEKSLERTKDKLSDYIEMSLAFTDDITIIGTKACRVAKNVDILSNWLAEKYQLKLDVISGERESYLNAIANVDINLDDSFMTFDLGGGSTEFSFISKGNIVEISSLPLGILNVYESGKNIKSFVANQLEKVNIRPFSTLIGIGGTVTSIASILLQQKIYDSQKIQGYCIQMKDLEDLISRVEIMDDENLTELLFFEPLRKDIFLVGLRIIFEIGKGFNVDEIIVSNYSIQHGILKERSI